MLEEETADLGPLGRMAIRRGLLDTDRVVAASREAGERGVELARVIVERGWLSDEQVRELRKAVAAAGDVTREVEPSPSPDTETRAAPTPRAPPPSPPDEALAASNDPAKRLGKFTLVRVLGRGGMGEVHRAWDQELGRFVAIKLLLSSDEAEGKRLLWEAQTAAKLEHEAIVPIYEVGSTGRGPFVVMKLIEGTTLERASLTHRQKAMAVRDVARAIAYAHSRGVIHRDLKPANILVEVPGSGSSSDLTRAKTDEPAPRVWVTDFGLARQASASTGLSATGVVVGTPQFMPPEQARGAHKEIDERSDVWSLGATLFDVLAGVPPFPDDAAFRVLHRVLNEDPVPMRRIAPSVPVELETIALRCLEKEKERRYPTALALACDLDRWLAGEPIVARPAGPVTRLLKRAKRNPWATALVALVALLALGSGAAIAIARLRAAAELRELEAQALAHEAKHELDAAADVWAKLEDRGHPGAGRRTVELRDRAEKGRRAERAREELARARRAMAASEGAMRAAVELEAQLARARTDTPEHIAPSKKGELWSLEERAQSARADQRRFAIECERSAQASLRLDDSTEARSFLAAIYLARLEAAEERRDSTEADLLASLAIAYGGDEVRRLLARPATLDLRAAPPGASIFLFRYEPSGRRHLPQPVDPRTGETLDDLEPRWPAVDPLAPDAPAEAVKTAREGTAYPLACGDRNRARAFPLTLPAGSYLVVFRRDDLPDVRVPVSLARGATFARDVELPGETPPGFIFVPGGPCVLGHDPELAQHPANGPRFQGVKDLPAFFIAKWEVTCGDYLAFLDDRSWHDAAAAAKRSPRARADVGHYWPREGDRIRATSPSDHPVTGISWDDAAEFARWMTRSRGQGKWTFRLPTEDEWEKAARGADGRFFVWGDRFDAGFCKSMRSRPGEPACEPIGLFTADESVYGARDLAGGVREWTATRPSPNAPDRVIKGGSYGAIALHSRAAYRIEVVPDFITSSIGFRLAAERVK